MLIGASICCFRRNPEICPEVVPGVLVSMGNSHNGVISLDADCSTCSGCDVQCACCMQNADEFCRYELVAVAEPVKYEAAIDKSVREIGL